MAPDHRPMHRCRHDEAYSIASFYLSMIGHAAVMMLVSLGSPGVAAATACEQRAKEAGHYIPVEELGDWDLIDDQTLLIWVPDTARAHLVHLSKPLPLLRGADVVSVVGGGKDRVILPCGRDGVEVDDDPRTRTAITAIEPLSEERTAELLRRTWSAIPIWAPVPRRASRCKGCGLASLESVSLSIEQTPRAPIVPWRSARAVSPASKICKTVLWRSLLPL